MSPLTMDYPIGMTCPQLVELVTNYLEDAGREQTAFDRIDTGRGW